MRATIIIAACLMMLASASAQQQKETMPMVASAGQTKIQTSQSAKSALEAYVSAWNRHDFAALDKLLTPDAIHEDIAWPFRAQGPAQIKDFMRQMIEAEPDFDWRLTTIVDGGSVVAAEWTWTATYTGDSPIGHVVRYHGSGRGASVAVIENGRIKRFTDYYDFASFFPKASPGSTSTDTIDHPSAGAATGPGSLEAKVRKAWEDFKNKNKESFAAILADGFREVEEDGNGFGDKQAILTMIDQFELNSYSLKDFNVEPIGKDAALITYLAHYEGRAGGQPIQANTAYGEVWVRRGDDWKLLHVQETNVR